MTEEEKKAIEMLKDRQKDLLEGSKKSFYSSDRELYKEHAEAIDTILNLIEKLKKENEDREQAHMKLYNEFRQYKDWDSIPKEKIKELIKKLEKAEKDIKIDAGAFKLPKADALTMFRLNILAGYASSVELLRILLEEE